MTVGSPSVLIGIRNQRACGICMFVKRIASCANLITSRLSLDVIVSHLLQSF